MLGWAVTKLPFRDITELNVLAALLTATGVALLFLGLLRLLHYTRGERDGVGDLVKSGLAALFVGLCGIWWRQGTGFEVYALHALFLGGLLYTFVGWLSVIEEGRSGVRSGFIFALLLGLSFTNHMSTIFLAPAFLFLYFARQQFSLNSFTRLAGLLPGFVLGLLPYLYLPIRAASDPRFNWGNPETLWGFIRHLSGAQYGVWMFTEPESFSLQSSFVFPLILEEMLFVGPIVALLGIWTLIPQRKGVAAGVTGLFLGAFIFLQGYSGSSIAGVVLPVILIALGIVGLGLHRAERSQEGSLDRRTTTLLFLLLIILTTILWAGGYSILDIESYYLAALVGIGGLLLFGLDLVEEWVGGGAVLIAAPIVALALIFFNYDRSNRSDLWLVEDAATNLLTTAPEKSVVISGLWDFWLSGSWYLQEVEGMRPDVAVLDHNLMKYSWYIDQLENAHPELMGRVATEVSAFRVEQRKFERDEPNDAARIDRLYVTLIDRIIATSLEADRPVLLTFDMNGGEGGLRYGRDWPPPAQRVPFGLGYLINPAGGYVPQEFPLWQFRKEESDPDGYRASLYQWYATSLGDRAQYEAMHGNDSLARAYLAYAITFDPGWQKSDIGSLPQGMAYRVEEMIAAFSAMRSALGGR